MSRRVEATDDVLRSNAALLDYIHRVQIHLLDMSLEMNAVARASLRRLAFSSDVRNGITEDQKYQAAKQIARSMRRAATTLNIAQRFVGKAHGLMQATFEIRRRTRSRGQSNNNNRRRAA
jgi:hypothetical protein